MKEKELLCFVLKEDGIWVRTDMVEILNMDSKDFYELLENIEYAKFRLMMLRFSKENESIGKCFKVQRK